MTVPLRHRRKPGGLQTERLHAHVPLCARASHHPCACRCCAACLFRKYVCDLVQPFSCCVRPSAR
eukprot:5703200-Pleurochrysis_carterae.AAC.1